MNKSTIDTFVNFASKLGIGADNLLSQSEYSFTPITRIRTMLEFCYRSSWIAGAVVDTIAQDMTRNGCEITGTIEPDKIRALEAQAQNIKIWDQLCDTIKYSRLYGGSLGILLLEGHDLEEPLDIDAVGPGDFKGIFPVDRWVVTVDMMDTIKEYGPYLGKPRYYQLTTDASALPNVRIHHTRVIRMDGIELPYWQRMTENSWGESVLERLWDRLLTFDSITLGAGQLAYRAHLRVLAINGLRDVIGTGGIPLEGLTKQVELMRRFQTNEGVSVIDTEDRMEAVTYSFVGLSDLISEQSQQISGSTGIPLARLFGQSPKGFSTGETDIRNYYDMILTEQKRKLFSGVVLVYNLLYRSIFGEAPPYDFSINFKPLWQQTEEEKSKIALHLTSAISNAFDSGLVDLEIARKELSQASAYTGIWSNIKPEHTQNIKSNEIPT